MSLCGQHSLGVHYNCIFQSSPTGFIIGGNMPLYSPSPILAISCQDSCTYQLLDQHLSAA